MQCVWQHFAVKIKNSFIILPTGSFWVCLFCWGVEQKCMGSKFGIAFALQCSVCLDAIRPLKQNKTSNKETLLFTDPHVGRHLKIHYRICILIPQKSWIIHFLNLFSFLERQGKKKKSLWTSLAEKASVSTILTGFSFLAELIFNGGQEASMTNICLPIYKQACELRLWIMPSEKWQKDGRRVDIVCWKSSDSKADREA